MDILSEIKARVSMKDLLESYGIYPCRGNNIYKCFAHDDHSPSANIVKNSDKFHCFSCAWTGDIFDVVALFEKCDSKQAIKIINEKFKLGLLEALKDKDKKELERLDKIRKKEKAEKEHWQKFENKIYNCCLNNILLWYKINTMCHPNRGEVRSGNWKFGDLYFYSLKRIELLFWIMDVIKQNKHCMCQYDFVYGTDKKELLHRIAKGEIDVC